MADLISDNVNCLFDTLSLMLQDLESLKKSIKDKEKISVLYEQSQRIAGKWLEITCFGFLTCPLLESRASEGLSLATGQRESSIPLSLLCQFLEVTVANHHGT